MDFSDDDSDASGPTASEVILLLTLPASAAPLSSSLMPRRHREKFLEYTKTVTVTEVATNSTVCHPGTCEVTVTNIDSGSGHPVSVNISHLHEQTVCEEDESGRCSPLVTVNEIINERTPTGSVEEVSQRIEHILRVETEGDVTFKHPGDNVIDLHFTTPVKTVEFPEITNPDTTLYYHSFKKEILKETANDLISPDSAVSDSPKRYMRSYDSDSDTGSLVIHSPVARPDSGVSSTKHRNLNGKNLSISVGSSEKDDLRYQDPSYDSKDSKNDRLPYYIVTSMSETHNSQQSPNTTTFFADLDTSGTTTTTVGMNDSAETHTEIHPHRYQKRGSRDREKRRSILVVTNVSATPSEERESTADEITDFYGDSDWNDSLPTDRTNRITMEVLFTPPTPKENGAPPKPPRRAKYGRSQLVEHIQPYEVSLDDLSGGPKMTSTPISTLEKKERIARRSVDELETATEESNKNETPVMVSRKSSKPPALPEIQPENSKRQSLASPRRSPSSPIIVVDQERKSSMELLVPPKQPRRKSTITDIDWFAAFNMKEPTTPKSPRSPVVVDALREVENAALEKRRPRSLKHQETIPLSPAHINLDDVFTYSMEISEGKKDEKCPCNACVLLKMSPEEIKTRGNASKRTLQEEQPEVHRGTSHHQHQEHRVQKHFSESDISLEDVFSCGKPPKVDNHHEYYTESPAKDRNAQSVQSTNMHDSSIFVFPSSDHKFNLHDRKKFHQGEESEISLEDVFESRASFKAKDQQNLDAYITHRKTSSTCDIINSAPRSPSESVQLDVTKKVTEMVDIVEKKVEDKKENQKSPESETTPVSEDRTDKKGKAAATTDRREATEPNKQEFEKEQRPERREVEHITTTRVVKHPSQKVTSQGNISLDDIFSFQSTSSIQPQEETTSKGENKGLEKVNQDQEDKFFTPVTSFSQLRNIKRSTSQSSSRKREETVDNKSDNAPSRPVNKNQDETELDIKYTNSDVSLDDVFAPNPSKTEHLSLQEATVQSDPVSKIAVTKQKVRSKPDAQADEEHNPLKPKHHPEFSIQKIKEEVSKEPGAEGLEDVNWLEELLATTHQPNETDLKETVLQLYDQVVASPLSSSDSLHETSHNLNDTIESGYTSLDRIKLKRNDSNDVSSSDSHPDLNKSSNPISSDRKHAEKTETIAGMERGSGDERRSKDSIIENKREDMSESTSPVKISLDDIFKTPEKKEASKNEDAKSKQDEQHIVESEEYEDYRDKKQHVSSESKRDSRPSSPHGGHLEDQSESETTTKTAPVEISLDDIFNQQKTKEDKEDSSALPERPARKEKEQHRQEKHLASHSSHKETNKEEQYPQEQSRNSSPSSNKQEKYFNHESNDEKRNARKTSAVEIDLDDIFNEQQPKERQIQKDAPRQDSSSSTTNIEAVISHTENKVYDSTHNQKHHSNKPREDFSWIETIVTDSPAKSKAEPNKGDEILPSNVSLEDVFKKPTKDMEKRETQDKLEQVRKQSKPTEETENRAKTRSESFQGARISSEPAEMKAESHNKSDISLDDVFPSSSSSSQLNVAKSEKRQENAKDREPDEYQQERHEDKETEPETVASKRQRQEEKSSIEEESREGRKRLIKTHTEKGPSTKMDWIEDMLTEPQKSKKTDDAEKKENEKNPEKVPVNAEDLLKEVFEAECHSAEKGDKCNCSACKVTNRSEEELKEYLKKQREKEVPIHVETGDEELIDRDDRKPKADGPIDLNDIFVGVGLEKKEYHRKEDEISDKEETKEEKPKPKEKKRSSSSEKEEEKNVAEQGKKDHGKPAALLNPDAPVEVDIEDVFFPDGKKDTKEAKLEKEERVWLEGIVDNYEKQKEEEEKERGEDPPAEINLDDVFNEDSKNEEKRVTRSREDSERPKHDSHVQKRQHDSREDSKQDATAGKRETQENVETESQHEKYLYDRRRESDTLHYPLKQVTNKKHALMEGRTLSEPAIRPPEQNFNLDNVLATSSPNASPVVTTKSERILPVTKEEDQKKEEKPQPISEVYEELKKRDDSREDSWIQDVMQNNEQEVDEPDTFEASYLKSIKEKYKEDAKKPCGYEDYYREEIEIQDHKKSAERRHLDDYYDEPEEEDDEEELDVGDFVNDILSHSLNEAAFKVAAKSGTREESERRTDTSADKNRQQTKNSSGMYVSTTASDNRMESIVSYPPSVASPVTPRPTDPGASFISEASMTLADNQDDDYIIRLVFAGHQKTDDDGKYHQPTEVPEANIFTESEVASRSHSTEDFLHCTTYETPETKELHQSTWSSQRTMSKTDEEILEVEVNQENYVIKGNYSIVISKHDPLGILLFEMTSGSQALDFSVTPKIRRLLLQCLKEKAKPNVGKHLSSRAKDILCTNDYAYTVYYEMYSNQYSVDNQTGNINWCTAENNVCNELVADRFQKHPDLFVPDYKNLVHYGQPGGKPEIRSRICKYLQEEYSSEVDIKYLTLLSSGNSVYDVVCHCLFESDDVILTNIPTYSRNFVNVSQRAQCQLVGVPFDLVNNCIDLKEYDRVFEERCGKGENVRGLVVINPHNPLGIVFSLDDLKQLGQWAEERNLWLIMDESFSQCVYDEKTKFESFLKLQMSLPVKSVWFWTLSKDFGLPGVKLSVVHTNDRELHYALGQMELTGPVSSLAQDFVANFLSDKEWLAKFKEDKLRRLRIHYQFVSENLRNLGIPFQAATGGIFVFADFRKKLSSQTAEGEVELFKELLSRGLYMTPGSHAGCPQPGWMRLVFACDKEELREGFRRLYELYGEHSSVIGEINY